MRRTVLATALALVAAGCLDQAPTSVDLSPQFARSAQQVQVRLNVL